MLIVFRGLPGTGKSTLARVVAKEREATYLRIDTIEQALRGSGQLITDVGPAGYLVAYALAEANLRLGRTVVADAVNALKVIREAWRNVSSATGTAMVDIEVVCSDAEEHRHRVETRKIDIPVLIPPTWQQVVAAVASGEYEAWDQPGLVLDTAKRTPSDCLHELRTWLDRASHTQRADKMSAR